MSRIVEHIGLGTDGFGRWYARITFLHTLSESDQRPEYNLGRRWGNLRKRARNAIVEQIAQREQKVGESYAAAERRVRHSLPPLVVLASDVDHMNRWCGVTFGER